MNASGFFRLDPDTLIAIAGMTAMTLTCRVGGYWLFSRMKPSQTLRDGFGYVPASMLIALIAPTLANAGLAYAVGAVAAAAAMFMTRSFVVATLLGLGACWAIWEY